MKKKLKKLFYLSLLLSGLIIAGCELQEDVIEQHNHQHELKLSQKRFRELLEDKNFTTAFSKIPKQKVLTTNILGRTQMEDKYGFTIFDTPVNVMESDTLIAYNLLIKRDIKSKGNYVENLVMNIFPQKNRTDAYIIKYVFDGTTEINPENFFELEKKYVVTPIIFNNEPFDEIAKQNMECIRIQELQCCDDPDGTWGGCHGITAACSNSSSYSWMTVDVVCNTSGGAGGGYDYSGAGGGGPDPHQGGSNGNTNPVYNNPTPPCDPRVNCPVLEDTTQIGNTPCDIIKNLQKDTNFKARMSGLIEPARNWSLERVTVVNENSNPTTTNNYTYANYDGNINSPTAEFTIFTNSAGYIHSHYAGLGSVFSGEDLQYLYQLLKNNPTYFDNIFLGLVTSSNTAYLLQIENRAEFIAFGDKYLADKKKLDNFIQDKMYKKYNIHQNSTNQTNEDGFLKMMADFNMGISLASSHFNATDTPSLNLFNSWTKLKWDKNSNQKITSKCN